MKKDIQRAILRACARFIGKKLEPVDGRLKQVEAIAAKAATADDLENLRAVWAGQLKDLALTPGPKGEDGKDAPVVSAAELVAELVKSEALAPLIDLMVADAVAKHFEANPVRDGRDGERGPQGEKGEAGERGADGKDGTGLADALIDRDGALVLTMTDGRAKTLGVVVGRDGADGKNGRDGIDFDKCVGHFDAERGYVLTFSGATRRWSTSCRTCGTAASGPKGRAPRLASPGPTTALCGSPSATTVRSRAWRTGRTGSSPRGRAETVRTAATASIAPHR